MFDVLIGVSLSEPHTSELNSRFSLYHINAQPWNRSTSTYALKITIQYYSVYVVCRTVQSIVNRLPTNLYCCELEYIAFIVPVNYNILCRDKCDIKSKVC